MVELFFGAVEGEVAEAGRESFEALRILGEEIAQMYRAQPLRLPRPAIETVGVCMSAPRGRVVPFVSLTRAAFFRLYLSSLASSASSVVGIMICSLFLVSDNVFVIMFLC